MTSVRSEKFTRKHLNALIKVMADNGVTDLSYRYEGSQSEEQLVRLECSNRDGGGKLLKSSSEKAALIMLQALQELQNPNYASEYGGGGKISVDAIARTLKHETFHWDLVCCEGDTFVLADGFVKSDDLR